MKVFTYSEARQKFSKVLDIARSEEVIIKRRRGETFALVFKKSPKSPFDVPGIKTRATTKDIIDAVRESRSRVAEQNKGADA
ncbi:MAG: type II toxin-antitoxin system prevent-host-death family antitoxin [Deltaproteobacteria bacterium]|nr:type II toxin-antitoxin system prevent-host-death family antitoxin [Deltaproteobacteria bacterium]MBW1909262.1 type II toxin-antitoxin system prevent-host-death family antitoxin [Deltaproteobacteria bacterium]